LYILTGKDDAESGGKYLTLFYSFINV